MITDIELLKIARKQTAEYVDMGHFRNPSEATPYLADGFQRGYRHAEKELSSENKALREALAAADSLVDLDYELATSPKHAKVKRYEKAIRELEALGKVKS